MKIIFAGNNLRAYSCLNFLFKNKIIPKLVIAHKKVEENIYFKNLRFLSHKLKLDYICPSNINSKACLTKLKMIKPDLMILCGYSQNILKKETFEIPKYGTWNLHASDLPKYRGASPLNWSIINNEKQIGISIIQVDESLDGGDIISKKFIKLKKNQTILDLTSRVNNLYPKMLIKEIKNLKKNRIIKKKQSTKKATFFKRRSLKDHLLNFKNNTASEIKRIVNASSFPYPEAYFFYKKKKVHANPSLKIFKKSNVIPGEILNVGKDTITIACKKDIIQLKSLKNNQKKINLLKF